MGKLSAAARWALAVVTAAAAAMLLCFTVRSTAMSRPAPLPRETAAGVTDGAERIDVNTAGLEELMTLPGIGQVRAQAILDDRAQNGPFRYPEDLVRVKGIGEGTLNGILDQITTGGGADAQNFGG